MTAQMRLILLMAGIAIESRIRHHPQVFHKPAVRIIKGRVIRGQSVLEYAVILACAVAALVAMSIYVKRGASGSLKDSADKLGRQYDPNNSTISMVTRTSADTYITERTSSATDNTTGKDILYTDTYMVTGPGNITDKDGDVIIPADPDRRPENVTVSGRETIARGGSLF